MRLKAPLGMRVLFRRLKARLKPIDYKNKNTNNNDIFNEIYQNKLWGSAEGDDFSSGYGTLDEAITAPYVNKIRSFINKSNIKTVVDLGCGDFNVGKEIAPYAHKYIAADASSIIIERNKKKYKKIQNAEFLHLDISKDKLPVGDVALVRQVLQHLSNEDIKSFVKYINKNRPYKYIVVTEHIPAGPHSKPNLDKITGANTRISVNSGVFVDEIPFNLKYKRKEIILEIERNVGALKTKIQTCIYKL